MPYTVTQADIEATTDLETAFGTTRLLPAMKDIPKEFHEGNDYTRLCDAIFAGVQTDNKQLQLLPGFTSDVVSSGKLRDTVTAHLRSFEPQHEHKIAGVGYLISKVAKIT